MARHGSRSQKVINGKKLCLECQKWLLLDNFHKTDSSSGRVARCGKCLYKKQKERAISDPVFLAQLKTKQSKAHKKFKYGLTQQDYENFIIQQNNSCAICCVSLDNSSKELSPHIDHCHKTGKIRGILCAHCNYALGHFFDNELIMLSAVQYIRNSKID